VRWQRQVYPFRDKQQDLPICYCTFCQGEIYDMDALEAKPLCDLCKQRMKDTEETQGEDSKGWRYL
jgi:hypothetical protein